MSEIGILDYEGKNNNPLTDKPYSTKYKELAKIWSKFPAYEDAKNIIQKINDHQVTLIISGTGSGKTVLIPKYVLHVLNYKGKIAVTLPKRIIAKSAAEFAADTLDVKIGSEVGYKFKGSKNLSEKTKLLYATDGTIVSMLIKDPKLSDYDAVIIDEAHERKVQIDFLLYLLKQTVKLRSDFKLIIMSATVNEKIFEDYFINTPYTTINIGSKTNYPIESIYLESQINVNEYIKYGAKIINNILNSNEEGDILFFVTSVNETLEFCKNSDYINNGIYCIEVYAGMNSEKQELAQNKDLYKNKSNNNNFNRKLVIATNVAESSLTIDGIKFVIDSGYELSSYYDEKLNAKILDKQLISKAQVKQRMGRAGRTGPGKCFHLYTKSTYDQMRDFPVTSILNSNIYAECLRLLNVDNIKTVEKLHDVLNDFIEPPKDEYFDVFIKMLFDLELIDNNEITQFGQLIAETQLDPMDAISAFIAYKMGCVREMSIILAFTEVTKNNISSLFKKPKLIDSNNISEKRRFNDLKNRLQEKMEKLSHSLGDHIVIYKIMRKFRKLKKDTNKLREWVYENFLDIDLLYKIDDYYHKLLQNLLTIFKNYDKKFFVVFNLQKYSVVSVRDLDLATKLIVSYGYGHRLNIVKYNAGYNYNSKNDDSDNDNNNIEINKESFINFSKKSPRLIVYSELFGNGKNNLSYNCVSRIKTKMYHVIKNIKINHENK